MIDDDQIYIVVDIETNGPVPGLYSMLSLGAVASSRSEELSSFYHKLAPLEDASQHPHNMTFWQQHPEAWQEVTDNQESAQTVIQDFVDWVKSFDKRPVFVSQPTAFDYAFVSWYLWKFTDNNPFLVQDGASATLDLQSFIVGKHDLKLDMSRGEMLPEWMKQGMPEHSHNALEDARGFGVILRNVLNRESES